MRSRTQEQKNKQVTEEHFKAPDIETENWGEDGAGQDTIALDHRVIYKN